MSDGGLINEVCTVQLISNVGCLRTTFIVFEIAYELEPLMCISRKTK